MLDPFQNKFGAKMGGFIFIPCVLGELMWCASILSALGSALSVILGISVELGVIVSTVTAVAYTLVGGLFAVAYVDIIQLVTVGLGLVSCHVPTKVAVFIVPVWAIRVSIWVSCCDALFRKGYFCSGRWNLFDAFMQLRLLFF
jgi:Na+/proline symporter